MPSSQQKSSEMNDRVKCPKCSSSDLLFVKELGKYLCKQCEQTYACAPAFLPLRIFLSYGHDANEELVHTRSGRVPG